MNVQERPQAVHYQARTALTATESLSQGDGRGAKGGDRSIYQHTGSIRQADHKIEITHVILPRISRTPASTMYNLMNVHRQNSGKLDKEAKI